MEYLVAFLGYIIYVLMSMAKTKASHKKEWNFVIYIKDHAITMILGAISVIVMMIMIDEIMKYFEIGANFKLVYSCFIGFANVALFKYIMDLLNPKKKKTRK